MATMNEDRATATDKIDEGMTMFGPHVVTLIDFLGQSRVSHAARACIARHGSADLLVAFAVASPPKAGVARPTQLAKRIVVRTAVHPTPDQLEAVDMSSTYPLLQLSVSAAGPPPASRQQGP